MAEPGEDFDPPMKPANRQRRRKEDIGDLAPEVRINRAFDTLIHQGIEDRRGDPASVWPADVGRYLDPESFTGRYDPHAPLGRGAYYPRDLPGSAYLPPFDPYVQSLGTNEEMRQVAIRARMDHFKRMMEEAKDPGPLRPNTGRPDLPVGPPKKVVKKEVE